jgi:putative ABC transport system permease protein
MQVVMNDVKYAVRAFLRTPGFTLVAVATLALGIGATTAIFTVVNAVLLKPLPYTAPERLVVTRTSLPDYRDLQRTAQSFEGTAAWASNLYTMRTEAEARQVLGGVISRDLLPLLGVQPILGRNFTEDDARQDTVVIGYGLWQSMFGGDPSVLGRTIELTGTAYTVVGVAPAWFRYPRAEFQLWTTLGTMETKAPAQARNRALRIFTVVGRLRPDVTLAQARAELQGISGQLARTYPDTNKDVELTLDPLYEDLVGDVRPALLVLLTTVGLLLLIACANVANLMLARATGREREIAIRSALGAGRKRLMQQLATEGFVLAAAGGVAGALIASWGVAALPALLEARVPRAEGIGLDARVLAFALGATVLTGLFFGLAPALHSVAGRALALKEGGRGVAGTSRGRAIRRTIVIAETALAVIVLVGAGLLVRSFMTLTSRTPGFDPGNVTSFSVQFLALPDGPARARAADALVSRLAQLPGVQAAGGSTGLPTVTPQRNSRFEIEGRSLDADEAFAFFMAATPGNFTALGAPIRRGRQFDASDTAAGLPVAVINETLANRLFAGQDPIGRRIRLINPEFANDWRTIVGVVEDVKYRGLDREAQPTLYTPFAQTPFLWLYVMVRTTGSPAALAGSIRGVVSSVDPALSAANVRAMTDVVAGTVATPRFNMLLVAGFAVLAVVLAAIGIYGVISYSTAQRTHEIGLRIALGAARRDVMSLVLGEGLLIATIGVALGLAGSAAVTRLMQNQLVGITARDPVAFAGGGLLLLVVAVAASWVPAWRATRVDPMVALRSS